MSAHLLDANALVYYYRDDARGQQVARLRQLPEAGPFYVTTLGVLEVRAAFGRMLRGEHCRPRDYDQLVRRFNHDCSSTAGWLILQPIRKNFLAPCTALIETHCVRGGCGLHTQDCIHLLSALDLKEREPALRLVTADRGFAAAADRAGLPVHLL